MSEIRGGPVCSYCPPLFCGAVFSAVFTSAIARVSMLSDLSAACHEYVDSSAAFTVSVILLCSSAMVLLFTNLSLKSHRPLFGFLSAQLDHIRQFA